MAARVALDDGRYEDAEREATALRGYVEQRDGANSVAMARALDLAVESLVKNGKTRANGTLSLAEQAVRLKESLHDEPAQLALSLRGLSIVHLQRGEFKPALDASERSVSILSQLYEPSDSRIATGLDAEAITLIQLEQFDRGQQLLDRSLKIRELHARDEPLELARTHHLIGLLRRYSGSYSEGAQALESSIAIWTKEAPGHPEFAWTLNTRADIAFLMGDVAKAQTLWQEALALATRTLRQGHPTIAILLRHRAVAAYALGYLAEARGYQEEALRIGDGSLPVCDPEFAWLLNDVANSMKTAGEFPQARRLFERERVTLSQCLGPANSNVATAVYNEGVLAELIGDGREGERLFRQSIVIWGRALGRDHPYVARGIESLAASLATRGLRESALVQYRRALQIRRNKLGNNHPDVAGTLVNIAETTGSQDRASALLNVRRAIEIYRRGSSSSADQLARALLLQGTLELDAGDYMAAGQGIREALTTRERVYGSTHPFAAAARVQSATVDLALGSTDSALGAALTAEQDTRNQLRYTVRSLPERQALAYSRQQSHGLELALSIVAAGHLEARGPAFDALIQSRGLVLDELAARARAAVAPRSELASLSSQMTIARQRFANLLLRTIQDQPISLSVLEEARREKEDAERAFAETSAAGRAEAERGSIGLENIRSALPAGSALISYALYDRTEFRTGSPRSARRIVPSYLAFVIRADSSTVNTVDVGTAAAIDPLIQAWRGEAGGRSLAIGSSALQAARAYRRAGTALRERLWDPVASTLHDVSTVFVVPDGAINLVTFAALPVDASHYLIETSPTIHYLTTERDLVPLDVPSTSTRLLAVGGAAFDALSQIQRGGASISRQGCVTVGQLHFSDLPGSRTEARDVVRLWPGIEGASPQDSARNATLLTGTAATETAVKGAVAGRRIIHFATHGFFLGGICDSGVTSTRGSRVTSTRGIGALSSSRTATPDFEENPLLLSGLAFAGANTSLAGNTNQDDGLLTAEEVAGLNLQGTEWAVLSACDTGIGEIWAGEGVFGLRRAFQIAGAHTVITSLWSVDDQATRQWMQALYEGRLTKRLSTADAVREASLRTIAACGARGQSTHPFYWAAFVAAGDWR